MRFAGRVVSWRLKAPDTPDTPPAPGSLNRFYQNPGVSELAVKTAPGWRLSPPRSRPTPTPVRQDSACAGRLRGPQAIQARLQPPARLLPGPRFCVDPLPAPTPLRQNPGCVGAAVSASSLAASL